MKVSMALFSLLLLLSLTGCMDITAVLQPENLTVAEVRKASDCVPIVLGMAYGRASLDTALAQDGRTMENLNPNVKVKAAPQKIAQIRRVQLHDYTIFLFGARCVEVVGD